TEEEKNEELLNIKNGFNFAKKVIATGECDLLILDEVLGIIDQNIISIEEFEKLVSAKEDEMGLILTGKVFPEKLRPYIDSISTIDHINIDKLRQEC
ncbi:MAG: cob(I)yrinic acid a,c-diamide adenosyltransferase, partial [Hungatella sp.]